MDSLIVKTRNVNVDVSDLFFNTQHESESDETLLVEEAKVFLESLDNLRVIATLPSAVELVADLRERL